MAPPNPRKRRHRGRRAEQHERRAADVLARGFVKAEHPCSPQEKSPGSGTTRLVLNPESYFLAYRSAAMSIKSLYRACISARLSPPNLSITAAAISNATTFSTITLAAEMAHTSLRS